MRILFIDPVCPSPYTIKDLDSTGKGLGGTEQTCCRIMRELAKRHEIYTQQRGREVTEKDSHGVTYLPSNGEVSDPNIVITLRDGKSYRIAKDQFTLARHYLWMHDVVDGAYRQHLIDTLHDTDVTMVSVSDWHKSQIQHALSGLKLKIITLPHPIESYVVKQVPSHYDKNKLIFTSSPHKGLDYVLGLFKLLKKKDNKFKLYISNPGYFKDVDKSTLPEGVVLLGSLPHQEVIKHVRESLCLFYPNISFAETFGLVYAEANAVGTPVIAHDIGAAREVLEHTKQIIDCTNPDLVVERVLQWKNGGRPVVSINPKYKLTEAIKEWHKLIRGDLK